MKSILLTITTALALCQLPASAQAPAEGEQAEYSPEVLKKAAELEAAERAKKHKAEIEARGKELKEKKYKGWKDYQLMYVADSLETELGKLKERESDILRDRELSQQERESAEQKNASADRRQAHLDKKAVDADRMAARFCNIRLSQRYKPEWHAEVMEIIPTITSESVVAEYTPSFELLKVYPQYYAEVKGVIEAAYREGRTTPKNAADREAFFAKWANAIKATEYYKKYYNTSHNIYYLNQQIDTFLRLLGQQRRNITDFYLVAFPEQ